MQTSVDVFEQKVLTVPITTGNLNNLISLICMWGQRHQSKYVCAANVHMLIEAYEDPVFLTILKKADLVTPDGMPLVWILKLAGVLQQKRIAGMDILLALLRICSDRNLSVFFVGSKDETLGNILSRIESEFPRVEIAGATSLPFKPVSELYDPLLIEEINQSKANIIFVALGCPKQEQWMAMHKTEIQGVMIGLGAAFEVFAGQKKWAPLWIRQAGLEWLFRLVQEPRRLWKRYLYTNSLFIYLVFKHFLLGKILRQTKK